MKLKNIKIKFTSEIVKSLSEQCKLLAWAGSGINFSGIGTFVGFNKFITILTIWFSCQYISHFLLHVSIKLKKGEK